MSAALALLAAAMVCTLPAGWDQVAARHTRYVIFGEYHGTVEAPAFVGNVACALAAKRERVLVAIEQQSTQDDALQAVWRGPDDTFAAALRALPNWKNRNDGVGSQAMFAMLVRLHALRAPNRIIDIVAFNGVRDDAQRSRFKDLPGQGPHEAAQAENIRTAVAAKRYDHVLVLTGVLHARTQPFEVRGIAFDPMAMRLAPRNEITALDMRADGGSTWGCHITGTLLPGRPIDGSQMSCKAFPLAASDSPGGSPRIALRPTPKRVDLDDAYDGYYFIGRGTASPPEVPSP